MVCTKFTRKKKEFPTEKLCGFTKGHERTKIINLLLGNKKKETIIPDFLSKVKINEFNKYLATVGFKHKKKLIKKSFEKIKYNF